MEENLTKTFKTYLKRINSFQHISVKNQLKFKSIFHGKFNLAPCLKFNF